MFINQAHYYSLSIITEILKSTLTYDNWSKSENGETKTLPSSNNVFPIEMPEEKMPSFPEV